MSGLAHVELGEVSTIERSSIQPESIAAGTQYLGLEHIESGGRILGAQTVTNGELASSKFRFSGKHLLYGKLRPYLAKIALPDFEGVCSTDILPVLPGPKLDRRYLCFVLRQQFMVDMANARSAGANLPRISPSELAKLPIPFPPLAEQKWIAGILDAADGLRAKRREALAQLDSLLQATFLDLFGDPVANPKGWKEARVGDVCTLVRGSSPRPQGDPRFFGGPVPRLMVADITRDGFWVTPQIDSLTNEGAKKSRPVPAGTIVMAVSGDVGVVARVQVPCCVHDGFAAFLDLNEAIFHPLFLLFQFHLLKVTHERSKAGAIFQNITTTDIKSMRLPTPPLEMQERFEKLIEASEKQKSCQLRHLAELDTLFASLQSRAFRGEL